MEALAPIGGRRYMQNGMNKNTQIYYSFYSLFLGIFISSGILFWTNKLNWLFIVFLGFFCFILTYFFLNKLSIVIISSFLLAFFWAITAPGWIDSNDPNSYERVNLLGYFAGFCFLIFIVSVVLSLTKRIVSRYSISENIDEKNNNSGSI